MRRTNKTPFWESADREYAFGQEALDIGRGGRRRTGAKVYGCRGDGQGRQEKKRGEDVRFHP